jgi:perosamine synthetase
LSDQLKQFDLIAPPVVDERVTDHSYYLFMLRFKGDHSPGLSKVKFVKALAAEGIPCVEGYPYPLYRNPMFDSHMYRRGDCPEAERMCDEAFWVSHEIMLAERNDLSDFVNALLKVSEAAEELAAEE